MGYSFRQLKEQREDAIAIEDWAVVAELHEQIAERLVAMYDFVGSINTSIAAAECYVKIENYDMARRALSLAMNRCNIITRLKPMVREKMEWLNGIINSCQVK